MTPSLVFDVVRGSYVDGPGLRTTVFLMGCPLRCVWCQNPEGQGFNEEISHTPERCIRCGACAAACPNQAINLGVEQINDLRAEQGSDLAAGFVIRREECHYCDAFGTCADGCDSLALRRVGAPYTVDEIVKLILRDRTYFETSGGGVTFSGGEPLAHMGYLEPVVRQLHAEGINATIETCGHFAYGTFERGVLPWVDHVLFDIKLIDRAEHEQFTGVDNEQILTNFGRLIDEDSVTVLPRVPLVPGITATVDNLTGIAELFLSLGITDYKLLPYNPSGVAKFSRMGKSAPDDVPLEPMSLDEEFRLKAFFSHLMEV